MKKHRLLPLVLALFLLLSACVPGGEEEDGLLLYFTPVEVDGGSALRGEPSTLTEENATVDALMAALLAGPVSPELASPFPRGVELLGYDLEEGCVTVDLSEGYGGLSDVELTMADYAIVLTLCQLPEVDCVRITAAGAPVSGRPVQELRPEDLLLSAEAAED